MALSDTSRCTGLAGHVLRQAGACGITLTTAESCTGGLLAALLSQAPGAGDHFHGGFVTYTKAMKTHVLGVPADVLRDKTAVCAEVAEAMAGGALERSPADIAVAVTGVTGPDPDEDGNPVGLIYLAGARRGRPAMPARRIALPADTPSDRILEEALKGALSLLLLLCAPEEESVG